MFYEMCMLDFDTVKTIHIEPPNHTADSFWMNLFPNSPSDIFILFLFVDKCH